MNILSQIFGIGAMISLFLIYQQKERSKMLKCKLTADICWTIHYILLDAYGGAIPNFVGIFRETVFLNREKHKWADSRIWLIVFLLINWGIGIFTFSSPINIMPIAASTIVSVAMWIKNPTAAKLISIPVSTTFLIYDYFVGSWIGIINEIMSLASIAIYFVKNKERDEKMATIFNEDFKTEKTLAYTNGQTITDYLAVISDDVSESAIEKGNIFSNEINNNYVSDFEKKSDLMAHVSTFVFKDGYIYMTYYANTESEAEDPNCQTARFVICPENDLDNKKIIDIQTVGDECGGGTVEQVYDTILMQKDEDTFVILWTAKVSGNYYRLYRTYKISENRLGDVAVNRFKVGNITNDFSTSGIKSALAENGISCKKTYADIGIMQKQSYRIENGGKYYYSGTYSGDFNCVIKSKDLITWEYVSQPDFPNNSKWENAVYVKNDRVYYFVRQQDHEKTGFLSYYDLTNNTWEKPVLIHDCQSRSDFIEYKNELYLFHAPKDREHIGIVKIDENNIKNSFAVAQSDIRSSCFYPFVEYGSDGMLYMSYTVDRKHIRLAKFDMDKIIK